MPCLHTPRIWQHLVEIVKDGQVSVIITTHYIEEAGQAHMVSGRAPSRHLFTPQDSCVQVDFECLKEFEKTYRLTC